MNKSRTENSFRNFIYGMSSKIIYIIVGFIARTIFIYLLNKEYLGINSLFTNILTLLSITELDIGTAIIFSMYKPIAENDKEKIKLLMNVYKKIYCIIGIIVFLLGIILIPFLKYIVGSTYNIKENLILIYFLFLINATISYFFSYKRSLISANQQEYINIKTHVYVNVTMNILQIIELYIFKNYIIYLVIQIIMTIIENLVIAYKTNKLYPFIKEKCTINFKENEKKEIFKNSKSMVLYKIGFLLVDNTDNIIISSMLGIVLVGLYSNYFTLITAIATVLRTGISGITSSVGNLNAIETNSKKKEILEDLVLLCNWLYGICGIVFLCVVNDFVPIWIGKEYVLDLFTVFSIVFCFYINGIQIPGYFYRITTNVITKKNIVPIIAILINIILSVILGNFWGLSGILLATGIARLSTTVWNDLYNVYKQEFNTPVKNIFFKIIQNFLTVVLIGVLCVFISNYIVVTSLWILLIKVLITFIIANGIMLLCNFRKNEFFRLKNRLLGILNKKTINI